ncbi:MAG: hypothetical protein P4M15_02235 [Alphaproteobacteria bacterium]|nr:hypothetical protein [Alphaproteobacteria bacterium]
MKKYFALLAVAILVCGCASAGNEKVRTETMSSISAKAVKGVTTKDQIRAIYGEPSDVSLTDGGSEVWKYAYSHSTIKAVTLVPIVGLFAGGADVDKNEVVFIFDKNNILQNYTVHASQSEVQQGGKDVGSD